MQIRNFQDDIRLSKVNLEESNNDWYLLAEERVFYVNRTAWKRQGKIKYLPLTGAPSMISYFAIVSFSIYVFGPERETFFQYLLEVGISKFCCNNYWSYFLFFSSLLTNRNLTSELRGANRELSFAKRILVGINFWV